METRKLGKTDIEITPIGLGCWQFSGGKGMIGRYWKALDLTTVRNIVSVSLDLGINWFDTAEAYGWGESERVLSSVLQSLDIKPGSVVIATKWFPALRMASNIGKTFMYREAGLNAYPVDLYQIHSPHSFSSVDAQMNAMADLADAGKIKSIGVSNFSAKAMAKAARVLEKRGYVLASNQVRYNLVDRQIENNGIMSTAQELGITIIAYSPLKQGLLTGNFHQDPELIQSRIGPRKYMKNFKAKGLQATQPLIDTLRDVALDVSATPAQVALNWVVNRFGETVVAIPGASKTEQAQSNAKAMEISLTPEQIDRIDQMSKKAIANLK